MNKYTNIIDLKRIIEHRINRKNFLKTFSIALQKVELTHPTVISSYVEHILPPKEYNNIEQYVKYHRNVLKKLGIKNNVYLTYLLFTFVTFANEYKIFMKVFIDKTFQK